MAFALQWDRGILVLASQKCSSELSDGEILLLYMSGDGEANLGNCNPAPPLLILQKKTLGVRAGAPGERSGIGGAVRTGGRLPGA
jgi:hypothetical protein